jgi:2-oxoglutarate ferredoxin oxidoreductase subunit beta
MTLILHDNQSFSLTTGQSTPTSQKGFISKAKPQGEENNPFNPIKIALACGATFIARTNARDIPHMIEIFTKAINHKGFSFIEVIQDCLIFNQDANNKDKFMYKIKDNENYELAKELSEEYNYNQKTGKIPIGIIYTKNELTLQEKLKIVEKNGK